MSDDPSHDQVAQDAAEDLELDGETAEAVVGGDKLKAGHRNRAAFRQARECAAPVGSGPDPLPDLSPRTDAGRGRFATPSRHAGRKRSHTMNGGAG